MQRLQAFKYELMPSGEHVRNMRRFARARRFVYNKALALQIERYRQGLKRLSYAGLCRLLTGWRNSRETPWLADAQVHTLQQGLKDLERAYRNFFGKRAGFPQFRKKGFADRFRYPEPKQIRLDQLNSRIFLPKLGWLRYRNSRNDEGQDVGDASPRRETAARIACGELVLSGRPTK
jgi:putative transposase